MKFKVGDKVKVTNPDEDYERYQDRVGKVAEVDPEDKYTTYKVVFSEGENDDDYFHDEELTLITPQFHVGQRVKNKITGETDAVESLPGMREYDNMGFWNSSSGMSLKKNRWERQENWEPLDEEKSSYFSSGFGAIQWETSGMCLSREVLKPQKKGNVMRKLSNFLKKNLDQKTKNFYKLGWIEIDSDTDEMVVTEEGKTAYVTCQMIGDGDMEKHAKSEVARIKKEEEEEE